MKELKVNINKPILVKSLLVYYYDLSIEPNFDEVAMYGYEPCYIPYYKLKKQVDIQEFIQPENLYDLVKLTEKEKVKFLEQIQSKEDITPEEFMRRVDRICNYDEDLYAIEEFNINKLINIYKTYPDFEDFLNEDIKTIVHDFPYRVIIESEKELINMSEDKVKLKLKPFGNVTENDKFNEIQNILKEEINIFDFLLLLSYYEYPEYFRAELEFLASQGIKNKECDVFIFNLGCMGYGYFKNPKIKNIILSINLLKRGLQNLDIGDEIPELLKPFFINNKINENSNDYILIHKKEITNENAFYLYIRSENNKIVEIITGKLSDNCFNNKDWYEKEILNSLLKKVPLNNSTYIDFINAKNKLKNELEKLNLRIKGGD